ncbi:MAG: site-2 protease family protein, partial [Clostridia bacterium]|nr:site-2 protease family protein [Clostridia bacterium]
MSTVLSVLAAFVLICVLVTVHEFGHYYVGKKLGFTILEFAVGMGPVIYKKNRNGIDYSIRLLPIGGMCQFYGEDEGIADGKSFNAHAAWKRFLVIAAGPLMNLLFALLISVVTLSVYGNYMPSVMEIASESPAERAGFY